MNLKVIRLTGVNRPPSYSTSMIINDSKKGTWYKLDQLVTRAYHGGEIVFPEWSLNVSDSLVSIKLHAYETLNDSLDNLIGLGTYVGLLCGLSFQAKGRPNPLELSDSCLYLVLGQVDKNEETKKYTAWLGVALRTG